MSLLRLRRAAGLAALSGALALLSQPALAQVSNAPTVRDLVEVADVEALALSPDSVRLAFRVHRGSIEENSYRLDWYVADVATGEVRRVASGGAPIFADGLIEGEAPVWSPDGRFLHYRALVDGSVGIWRTSIDGSGSRLVVAGDADVESLAPGPDGQSLLYVTGPTRDEIRRAESQEYDEGVLIDDSVDIGQRLVRGGWIGGRLASQRLVGRWYSRAGLLWQAPRTRHRLDLKHLSEGAAEAVPAAGFEPLRPGNSLPAPTATSRSGEVATAIAGQGDAVRVEVHRAGGEVVACAAPECRTGPVVAIAWRPGSEMVLFTTQDAHVRQRIFAWDVARNHVRAIAGGTGQLAGGRRPSQPCAFTSAFAICVAADAAEAPRLVRISLDTGRLTVLHDPNPGLRSRAVPIVEHLTWRLPDGRSATGTIVYYRSARPRPAPLFINYYLCRGFLRGGVGDDYPLLPLAGAGFVAACLTFVPNAESDGVGRYRDSLASVQGLVDLLAARGMIDRARIGMGGFSFGSEATMWVAMNSHLLAAAAITSPQFEPAAFWMANIRGRDHAGVLQSYFGLGSPDEDPEGWRRISPALNTNRITAPLLMQLSEQETRAGVELYSRLSNTTTPVELYAFPDEAHVKLQPRHRAAMYQRNLDWFRYWLQDYADPDPARAAQYRRWGALRVRRSGSAVE